MIGFLIQSYIKDSRTLQFKTQMIGMVHDRNDELQENLKGAT